MRVSKQTADDFREPRVRVLVLKIILEWSNIWSQILSLSLVDQQLVIRALAVRRRSPSEVVDVAKSTRYGFLVTLMYLCDGFRWQRDSTSKTDFGWESGATPYTIKSHQKATKRRLLPSNLGTLAFQYGQGQQANYYKKAIQKP